MRVAQHLRGGQAGVLLDHELDAGAGCGCKRTDPISSKRLLDYEKEVEPFQAPALCWGDLEGVRPPLRNAAEPGRIVIPA